MVPFKTHEEIRADFLDSMVNCQAPELSAAASSERLWTSAECGSLPGDGGSNEIGFARVGLLLVSSLCCQHHRSHERMFCFKCDSRNWAAAASGGTAVAHASANKA